VKVLHNLKKAYSRLPDRDFKKAFIFGYLVSGLIYDEGMDFDDVLYEIIDAEDEVEVLCMEVENSFEKLINDSIQFLDTFI